MHFLKREDFCKLENWRKSWRKRIEELKKEAKLHIENIYLVLGKVTYI